jgi:hypothetical protein
MKAHIQHFLAVAMLCTSCSSERGGPENIAQRSEMLSGAQALQFESTSPWSPGGTTLALSTTKTQGSSSLRVTTPTSYHEIAAANLTSVGAVGTKLALDLRLDRAHTWGTLRAIVKLPSRGAPYNDLGELSLAGRPVNQFFRAEYTLPAHVQTALAGSYSDLEVRFIVTATPAVYLLDNGSFAPSVAGPTSSDVGATGAIGSASVNGGIYTVKGAGDDIEYDADAFHFLYKSLTGDGQIVARIDSVTNTDPWTKVGVMVRDSLSANAKNALFYLLPTDGSAFQYRETNSGGTLSSMQEEPIDGTPEHKTRYLRPAKWLKLTRKGDVIKAYSSDDALCWEQRWTQTLAFDDTQAFFGVALTSSITGTLATAAVSGFNAQNTIEPINASCDRANADGDPPIPPTANWIFPPGRFGTSNWAITTTNPNGVTTPVKCNPAEQDAPDAVAWRKDGPDHPNCPDLGASPNWTKVNFAQTGWQLNKPSGFGSPNEDRTREVDKVSTPLTTRGLWARKTFTVTAQQKSEVVLYGRWGAGITVYINGVLATNNANGAGEYRYLGLSDEARAAIVPGATNVIAVRLEWEDYFWVGGNPPVAQFDYWDRFLDIGLAREPRLASLPMARMVERAPSIASISNTFREALQEQGVTGATLSIRKYGETVVSSAFGWRDKNLTTAMPRGAIMRLASNDKVITQAAIVKLMSEGRISPHERVFPFLNLQPIPGRSPGANVNDITVEHLRLHTSGIGYLACCDQQGMDEMAFTFGVSTAQLNKHHMARWLYTQDASDVGGAGRYSSDGYFLLRYLIERLVAPKTLEQYLAQDMGLTDIVVSSERLLGREPNEPAYVTYQQPWDRWITLDEFMALGASSEGFAAFFDNFYMGYGLEPDGTFSAGGGGFGGGMAGTWSISLHNPDVGLSFAMVANNGGAFDVAVQRIDTLVNTEPCILGSQDPRAYLQRFHFVQNVGDPTREINTENGLAASPTLGHWHTGMWMLESVDGTNFRIRNRAASQYLQLTSGSLQVVATPSGNSAQWQLVSTASGYRLRNRAQTTHFVTIQNGVLTASTSGSSGSSGEWRFCQ